MEVQNLLVNNKNDGINRYKDGSGPSYIPQNGTTWLR